MTLLRYWIWRRPCLRARFKWSGSVKAVLVSTTSPVDGQGIPLAVSLTGGNRNDLTQLLPPLDKIPAVAGRAGRPRRRPYALLTDRAYDHVKYRRLLWQRGIRPVISEVSRTAPAWASSAMSSSARSPGSTASAALASAGNAATTSTKRSSDSPSASSPTATSNAFVRDSYRVRPGVTMTDRGWYDDSEYHDAVQRAERATRFGWATMAGTAGALGCALIVAVALCVVAV